MALLSTLSCPDCRCMMREFEWHGTVVDICPQCHGIWLDEGEVAAIEASDTLENIDRAFVGTFQKKTLAEGFASPARNCPRDTAPLEAQEWNWELNLVIDFCPVCHGIWLDAGELEGYVGFMKDLQANPAQITEAQRREMETLRDESIREIEEYVGSVDWGHLDWLFRSVGRVQRRLGL